MPVLLDGEVDYLQVAPAGVILEGEGEQGGESLRHPTLPVNDAGSAAQGIRLKADICKKSDAPNYFTPVF